MSVEYLLLRTMTFDCPCDGCSFLRYEASLEAHHGVECDCEECRRLRAWRVDPALPNECEGGD